MNPTSHFWSDEAEGLLRLLMQDVLTDEHNETLESVRKIAEQFVHDEAREEVRVDDVVAAFIVQTPQHLRDGLRMVLSTHGIDADNYRKFFDQHLGRDGFRDVPSALHRTERVAEETETPTP